MIYELVRPLLMALDPETAHRLTLRLLALPGATAMAKRSPDDPILATEVFGRRFANPLGIAAGFDKDAVAAPALMRLGFGFVEVGTVTPLPQAGNPRPRLFRLTEDRAVINRMGFNNGGLQGLCRRIAALADRRTPLVVNIGANKDSADRAQDYVTGLTAVARLADLVTVNVSSPNTPGLRGLQDVDQLANLLGRLAAVEGHPPLLLKVAPDLDDEALADIAGVVRRADVAGIVVANTTVSRPALRSRHRGEAGGLSGRPLFDLSTDRLRGLHRETAGAIPLVGVGGIESGETAYAKIRAGAALVQLYSALVYEGPGLVGRINRELAACLRRDGFGSVAEAVGA
ncbi:MAG: quinone-dependent dihydroorotate dehydrogenase [Alphaproteobacteria bacterium]